MKPCVYRYVDELTNTVKYVGITHKSELKPRLNAHKSKDDWAFKGIWRIEYFECENRSEAEAFESHLIALYETWKFYNKQKKNWGINRFLPDVETWWKVASEPMFDSLDAMYFYYGIRCMLKMGKCKEIREMFKNMILEE